MIDASARGALMKKTTDQAYEILEDAATNTNQWPREKATPVIREMRISRDLSRAAFS